MLMANLIDGRVIAEKVYGELRGEIAVGLGQADRGETAPLDVPEIKREIRRRLAAQG